MSDHEGSVAQTNHQVPAKKQTSLGLYVTAEEAYEMWKADPEHVKVLDVRTPEEYLFVGHAEMARNIPLLFVKYEWDADKNQPVVAPNPDFISDGRERVQPGGHPSRDMQVRRSQRPGRSTRLPRLVYADVYNTTDGFEESIKVDDPGSAYHGKRMRNGWKNSGSPWTYEVDPALLWLPKGG